MRVMCCVVVLVLVGGLAWGNGDPVIYNRNTGVILPAAPTAAKVEREKLEIQFAPYEPPVPTDMRYVSLDLVKVRAQYWIVNPTDKSLKLDIGFPVPGGEGVVLRESPVRLDGKLVDWQLHDYNALFRPLRGRLHRAVKEWRAQHPGAVKAAQEFFVARARQNRNANKDTRRALLEARRRFFGEMARAGVQGQSPNSLEEASYAIADDGGNASWKQVGQHIPKKSRGVPVKQASHRSAPVMDDWILRAAILATGQRRLLPEGHWQMDTTTLDPATGRLVEPSAWQEGQNLTLLTFPLHLQPRGRHQLTVIYRQRPNADSTERYNGQAYHFNYVLRTIRGWASFGPIDVTVTAPSGLALRSLPRLVPAGKKGNVTRYRAVLNNPRQNLQIALATEEALLPRLKMNGQLGYGANALVTRGVPLVAVRSLNGELHIDRIERAARDLLLTRPRVTVRVTPGGKQIDVDGASQRLAVPVTVRNGRTYVPVEVLHALYPEYQVTLSYHAPSHTVLLNYQREGTPAFGGHARKMRVPHSE